MAAKTIDPATGASTWALGSHKCTVNIGSLTRKASKTKSITILRDQTNWKSKGTTRRAEAKSILEEPSSLIVQTSIRRSGREAATV